MYNVPFSLPPGEANDALKDWYADRVMSVV